MGLIKTLIRKADPVLKPLYSYHHTIFPYYHTVSDHALPHIDALYSFKTEKEFEKDLDFLLQHYKVLDPAEMVKRVKEGTPLPHNSFLLSFDDGLAEVYQRIVPILNRKGVPGVFFINNSYIGNSTLFYKHKISLIISHIRKRANEQTINELRQLLGARPGDSRDLLNSVRALTHHDDDMLNDSLSLLNIDQAAFLKTQRPYLTYDELQHIKDEGHFLGGHTVNHYPMDKLTLEEQVKEVLDSITWLKGNFNLDYELFSFPFSDSFASVTLFDRLFRAMPGMICMGNSGMRKDVSHRIIQRFSLEKEPSGEVGVRMNLAYEKYLALIGKRKIARKTL